MAARRRTAALATSLGLMAYLAWRLTAVVSDPALDRVVLVAAEALAVVGLVAFFVRMAPPRQAVTATGLQSTLGRQLAVVDGAGHTIDEIERTILSLDDAPDGIIVVDDADRGPLERSGLEKLVAAAHGHLITSDDSPLVATMNTVGGQVDDQDMIVVVRGGSLFNAEGLACLHDRLAEPAVAVVQARPSWSDDSTLTIHGPSQYDLTLFNDLEAPAASAAGIAPLLGDGTAWRVSALRSVIDDAREISVALAANRWLARYEPDAVIYQTRPASAAAWSAASTERLVVRRRRASAALRATKIPTMARVRLLAEPGDLFSAAARLTFSASVTASLVTGRLPLAESSAGNLAAMAAVWTGVGFATRAVTDKSLRAGDRARAGWRNLDAHLSAFFAPRSTHRSSKTGRLRALRAFPITVTALIAIDVAATLRGLTMVRPGIVSSFESTTARLAIGAVALCTFGVLVDALRIFVARSDARGDLRARASVGTLVTNHLGQVDPNATITNLSTTGAGVMSYAAIQTGERVRMQFDLSDPLVAVDLEAVVVRSALHPETGHALGVRFDPLPAAVRHSLARFVATNPPIAAPPNGALGTTAAPAHARPLVRLASMVAAMVMGVSLAVVPAGAAPANPGSVSGVAVNADGPVQDICVSATDDHQWHGTMTGPDGTYTMELPSGTYQLEFRDCRWGASDRLATSWWSSGGTVNRDAAEYVVIAESASLSGLNVTMVPGGWFAGTVLGPDGSPLSGVCVNPILASTGDWNSGTTTPTNGGPAGSFETPAVLDDRYLIHVNDCSGLGQPFGQGYVGNVDNQLVSFQEDAKVYDMIGGVIDVGTITMVNGARFSGTVRDDSGAPVEDVCVSVVASNWQWAGGGRTDPDGTYLTDAVLPGEWSLNFEDCRNEQTLVRSVWTGRDEVESNIDDAGRVNVDGSSAIVGPYDQTLYRGSYMAGQVLAEGTAVGGACVGASIIEGDDGWNWLAGTQSNADGSFRFGPVYGDDIVLTVSSCNSSPPIFDGGYVANDQPLTRDRSAMPRFTMRADTEVEGLVFNASFGSPVSGIVNGDGAPLANACVALIDETTGAVQSDQTRDDGTWSTVVPSASYLVYAYDCEPGRGFAGRFAADATTPDTANLLQVTGGQTPDPIVMNLPSSESATIKGRVETVNGEVPEACVILLIPNSDPLAVAQVDSDGAFELGPVNAGSFAVAIAGCDFSQGIPPGVTDPSDPDVVYPLQFSSGAPLDPNTMWTNAPWVNAAPGTPTDLGTICLAPCGSPEATPTSATPTSAIPTTTPEVATTVPTPTTPLDATPSTVAGATNETPSATIAPTPEPVAPKALAFATSSTPAVIAVPQAAPSVPTDPTTEQAIQSIAPIAPNEEVVVRTQVKNNAETRIPVIEETTLIASTSNPVDPTGSTSWTWIFAMTALVGIGLGSFPWLRTRFATVRRR